MSKNTSTGEKTEQPTSKRLRDARREGDVAKSRDLTQTATLLVWVLLLIGLSGYYASHLGALLELTWTEIDITSHDALRVAGIAAAKTAMLLSAIPLGIAGLCGVLIEFLQVGPIFAPQRLAPQAERLNPASGFKRVFSLENLFELAKSLVKTAILVAVILLVAKHYLADILELPVAGPGSYVGLDRRLIVLLCAWVVVLFAFLSIFDRLFQGFNHRKRLRMSKHDIRRERKEDEGDPSTRGQRSSVRRQWATQSPQKAAREATALLVNPTHIAVAIWYEPERTAVPVLTAKGEGNLAHLMRLEAERAGVPVIRNIPLARALHFRGEEHEFVPEEFFDAIAEVIACAEKLRAPPGANP
jgi:type III secretion protein U